MTPQEQLDYLTRNAVDVIQREELSERLENSAKTGVPLRAKLGLDPTAPDIHVGHVVVIDKLKHFQDCGHEVVFIVGDFTCMIGDPSGRNTTRPVLSKEEIAANAETYTEQVFKILDPDKTRVEFNSSWLGKLGSDGLIQLASQYTVARMLERDDFDKRYKSNQSISVHELLYPLVQAYDSVAIEADVELGGHGDQTFNLLVGRSIQQAYGQKPQVVLTTPLLVGLDGTKKMSKSLGNYIGITEPADEMFGKTMSIPDELMWDYWRLCLWESDESIQKMQADIEAGTNPRDIKLALASKIVARYHNASEGDRAQQEFLARFQQGALPSDLAEVSVACTNGKKGIAHILKEAGLVPSTSEANRMITQGAVKIDGEKVEDRSLELAVGAEHVIQVGKRRVAKVTLS